MIEREPITKEAIRFGLVLSAILVQLCVFSVSFSSAYGQARGTKRVQMRPNSDTLYSESYALFIGVSHYQNGWPELPGVAEDAVAVTRVLQKHGFRVEQLLNPSRQKFDQWMRDFISKRGQKLDNRLVIYFAGHGYTLSSTDGKTREMGYLVLTDAPLPGGDNIGPFKTLAISMDEIATYARKINSRHALFVFDSCFSGLVHKLRRGAPLYIKDMLRQPVRQFISAGSDKQSVSDKSVFRRQLVAALSGEGDEDCTGYITGTELGKFLHRTVTEYTNGQQTPQIGTLPDPDLNRGDLVFRVLTPPKRCKGKLPFSKNTEIPNPGLPNKQDDPASQEQAPEPDTSQEREPSQEEMRGALLKAMAARGAILQGDDTVCVRNIVAGMCLTIERFEKLGCSPADRGAGYFCTYKHTARLSNDGSTRPEIWTGFMGNSSGVVTRRFVRGTDGWMASEQ